MAAAITLLAGVLSLSLLVAYRHRGPRVPRWSAASLAVPSADARWTFAASIDGRNVRLMIPDDVPDPSSLPPSLKRKLAMRRQNVGILAALAKESEATLSSAPLESVPEYYRSMDDVVASVHPRDGRDGDPLWRHRPVLERLPPYTRIVIFAPEDLLHAVWESLESMGLAARSEVRPVAAGFPGEPGARSSPGTTTWAHDLFLVSRDGAGSEWIVAPAAHARIDDLRGPDNEYLDALASPPRRRLLRVPIFFRAGNIQVGRTRDGRALFVGGDEISYDVADTYGAASFFPPQASITQLLQRVTGTDRAVVLPNSANLFHLDMAFSLLDDRVAAVLDPIDPEGVDERDRQVLATTSTALASLGYRIVRIPTLAHWMRSFQSPVNVIAFVDRRDGVRTVIVPRYTHSTIERHGRTTDVNDLVKDSYEREGFRAISVEDRFDEKHGDIHCAFNVLD